MLCPKCKGLLDRDSYKRMYYCTKSNCDFRHKTDEVDEVVVVNTIKTLLKTVSRITMIIEERSQDACFNFDLKIIQEHIKELDEINQIWDSEYK